MRTHYILRMVLTTVGAVVARYITLITPIYTMVNAWCMGACACMVVCTAYYGYMAHTHRDTDPHA